MGIQNRTKEEIHILEGNIATSTRHENGGKNNSLSGEMETGKRSGIHSKSKWRKILDVSSMNKEIQMIHFKMNGTDQVRDLIRKGEWATNLDLKSAFHHIIVFPPHRPYLTFETIGKVYQYRAMPFGTQHSPIFFAQALAMVLTKIGRETDRRILNFMDDLFLLNQN
ncbi:MAG: hypothetical protein EZS28_004181 [Streblomastix strix]|uniref:Reverse transcriptase domain-containing protein n=1 Tax=Streblomastix strix TaxID=222440 RepID=A0A5J4WZ78_9EUKA|nr:MAG: hypothetical protein EZS28_004181 [Streblomastix strix]